MRHIYGYTSSFFKTVLRSFAVVSVWPRCLIAFRWKLCSESEIFFAFSSKCKSFTLCSRPFVLRKVFYILRIPVQSLLRFMWIRWIGMLFFSLKHFLSFWFGLFRRFHSDSKNTACAEDPWVTKYEAVFFIKIVHWSVLWVWPVLKPNWLLSVVRRKGEMLDNMKGSSSFNTTVATATRL